MNEDGIFSEKLSPCTIDMTVRFKLLIEDACVDSTTWTRICRRSEGNERRRYEFICKSPPQVPAVLREGSVNGDR